MRKLLFLVLLAVALMPVLTGCGGGSKAAGGSTASEALAGLVVLTQDDMPGFTGSGGVSPCGYGLGQIGPGPGDILACAMSSFLTNEAYTGEGRAQIDAQARAEGYDPYVDDVEPGTTPQPWRPVQGPFVSTHHGIFELYAPVTVLSSPEAAHDYLLQSEDSARGSESGYEEVPSSIGDESLTLKAVQGPDPQTYETSVRIIFRRGRVVVDLNTLGSPDLSVEENWRLASLMDGRIQSGSGVYDTLPTLTPPTESPTVCPEGDRFTGGYLVRLPPDAAFTPHVAAPFLAEANPALAALGLDQLYVSDSNDPADLPAGAEVVAPLYLEATDPSLCTDNFDLADPPGATAIRDAAIGYLTSTGTVSEAKLADGSTQWYVSDDSLPNGLVAVYTLIQTPSPFDGVDVVMTVFQGKDGPIAGAASVNFYAAGPESRMSCSPVTRFQSGYLVRLPAATAAPGGKVAGPLLASSSPALSALGFDRLYVAGSSDPADLPPDFEAVTPLYLMAADSALHTCDYKLADRPAAVAMRDAAMNYLTTTGLVSASDVRAPSTVWMISDTDLPGGTIAVYAQLQNSPSASEQPGNRDVVMTVFQGKAGPIVGAARVNLCPADSPSGAAFVAGSMVPCGGATEGQSAP
ncbi:MAG: hypothetical protein ABSC13_03805 [Dehalococcoidia bacterium]|jgi:hypothetical protein